DIQFDFTEGAEESVVIGFAISKVLDSKNPQFPIGSTIFGPANWESLTILEGENKLAQVVNLSHTLDSEIPLSAYNSVLGLTGLTVWDSLNKIGDLKKG